VGREKGEEVALGTGCAKSHSLCIDVFVDAVIHNVGGRRFVPCHDATHLRMISRQIAVFVHVERYNMTK
jgi:hypothetical protein